MTVAVLTSVVLVALAAPAFAGETVSGEVSSSSAVFDGIKGNQGIRTDPATVSGVGYNHPVWVVFNPTRLDFVSIGTYNGLGASGISSCPNDYDSNWNVYEDRIINDDISNYSCNLLQSDSYGAGTNPTFQISYGWCPSQSANRWLMYFGGVLWSCHSMGYTSAQILEAGLETTGSSNVDRNIEAKYTNMKKNLTGSTTWYNLSASPLTPIPSSYSYTTVSSTAFNTYLAPLD